MTAGRLAPGAALPPAEPVFPRYVETPRRERRTPEAGPKGARRQATCLHSAVPVEQLGDRLLGQRAREQEALQLGAAGRGEELALLLGLHAFRGDHQPERLADIGDGLDDRGGIGRLPEILHEGAVDLHLVDLQPAQMREARIAGAEIVERDPHAGRAQVPQAAGDDAVGVEERVLGDLELQPRRIEAALADDLQDARRKLADRAAAPARR